MLFKDLFIFLLKLHDTYNEQYDPSSTPVQQTEGHQQMHNWVPVTTMADKEAGSRHAGLQSAGVKSV